MDRSDFLLCTDLDGTVLGDAEGEAAFRAWAQRMRGRVLLAYVSGRSQEEVRSLIQEGRLPQADYSASSVGTEVCDLNDRQNRLGRHYQELADPAWPARRFRELGVSADIELQGAAQQSRFKASFYWNGQPESLAAFRERLIPERDWRLIVTAGRYLDVLPHCFGKGPALRFLAAASGISLKRCIAAGDMEHDLEMLEAAGSGIVPSNALPAVKDALSETGCHVSTLPQAWGVLEGLGRLGLS